MEIFNNKNSIRVQQIKEKLEIFTGFETKNKYQIFDEQNLPFLYAYEESGGFMRVFLKSARPFKMFIIDNSQKILFSIDRPFKWIFSECNIIDNNNQIIATVKWEFSVLKKKYSIYDRTENKLFTIEAPAFKPWTFFIKRNNQEVAIIQKKWSGLLKETFTDADNFGIQYNENLTGKEKAILLGTLFLIDFVHFENKN